MQVMEGLGTGRRSAIRAAPRRLSSVPDATALAAVAFVALVIRIVLVVITRHSLAVINDAADYNRLGVLIATGHGFGVTHAAPGGGPTALRPPAFPLLVGGVYAVFGDHVTAARLIDALLGALAVVLVSVLILQLGGDRRRALAGGLLAAVFPPMVIASTSLMSEALFGALSLGVVSCALAYRHGGRVLWLALSGLQLGLATLTRPIGAVLVIPAALIAFVGVRHPRRGVAALAAGVLALAPCAAWEIRDVSVFHRLIPLTTQDGYFLAGTYNATAAHVRGLPGVWLPPSFDPVMARVVASHPHAGEARLNDLFEQAALDYAGAHPGYIVTVAAHNFLRLFDFAGLSFTQESFYGEYGYGSAAGTLDLIATWAVIALAAVGLARGGARSWPAGVWLVPLLMLAVTLPTRGNPRFRAPIDPYLVILASAAIAPPGRSARLVSLPPPPAGS